MLSSLWDTQLDGLPVDWRPSVTAWRVRIIETQTRCDSLCKCTLNLVAGLATKMRAAQICLIQAAVYGCAVSGVPADLAEYTTNFTLRYRCGGG